MESAALRSVSSYPIIVVVVVVVGIQKVSNQIESEQLRIGSGERKNRSVPFLQSNLEVQTGVQPIIEWTWT